jgi:membrane-associated phospholipid phosphatase
MNKTADIISHLFHPLLMATYGCLIVFFGLSDTIYFIFTPLRLKLVLTFTIFAFTFLLPVLNLLILYKLGYVSSLAIDNRKERTFPLLMTALCYFGLFYMIYDFNIWPAIKLFILGGGLCIFFAAIVNLWWQISAHMIGVGGLIGALLAMCYFMQMPILVAVCICIIVAGAIGFARLKLNAHSPSQVYAGFIFGCILQFSLFFLAQSITFV